MRIVLLIILFAVFIPSFLPVRAEYMLPYPSYMPGNTLYRITRITDRITQYWYFGNIAQFKYHLRLSDKYLVEAKTLFEYKQYLLASDALSRSDAQFSEIPDTIRRAGMKHINTQLLTDTFRSASQKHAEVLKNILSVVPERITWSPENERSTELDLNGMIRRSLQLREKSAWK